MKISKLQIGSFGKFKDYELDLKDGFQIVYGKNEDGKSTLMAFIKMMFYSKIERGRDIDKNLRKKYQPWDGSMMNGAVEFEQGGISYRLQKDIGATPGADKVKLIKMGTGETVSLGKNEEVGKRFFELDLAGFERSVFISQIGSFSANGKSDEVSEKLISNLVLSGDENISQQQVMNRLNDATLDMESKNRKKGIFIEAKNELESLQNERADIQMLESEQQENMEKYHRLKEQLKQQKNIRNLLKLNIDKNKFKQLTSLIEKITKYTELEKTLEKEDIPYESLTGFLEDCNSLMDESEKTKGSLQKLKGSIDNELRNEGNLIPIREDEYKHLIELVLKEKKLKELLKRIDEDFIPVLTSYIEAKNDRKASETLLKNEEALVKELQKFHEEFQKYQDEKNINVNEKENLINNFEREKLRWNSDKQLREQWINFTSEKLLIKSQVKDTGSQKSKKKNPLLTLSIVIGIISIILSVVIPPALIGVIIAIIMGVRAVKSNKQNQTTQKDTNHDDINSIEQELKTRREENDKEEALITEKTKEYESKISDIANTIVGMEKEIESLTERSNNYQNSLGKVQGLTNEKEMALNLLNVRQETYLKESNYLLEKYSEDSSLEEDVKITVLQQENLEEAVAREYRSRIEELCDALRINLEEKMKEKSCLSVEEFENKYLEYASDSKNRTVITEAEHEYLKKVEEFSIKVKEYEIVQSYEEAKLLTQKLWQQVTQLEKEKDETLNIAKGMGYNTPSLEYLMSEISKLEPSIKELEEVGVDSYEVEELQQKEKDFAGENLDQQFFELQKKIKTPDKNLSQVQEEIDEKSKEVNEKENYFNCLKIASQVMQEATDEMRQSFGPELNRKTAGIFNSLTNGKYGNILVTKDYDISIQSGIHYREWRYLSGGTVDQAYLALRLAITELISDKNVMLPLFLDDVMMQYDDERMDAALKFISDYAKEKGQEFQLLLFTCHKHIIDNSKPYNTEVVNI
ncbi:AAA family ATPase [Clostridium sp.]|uniref:AAA family ATPase n=1 Tax=Clostridium sp. TaxID=1506 RepID=UPI001A4A3815|nr:AAA family ATPase [Clostridium sp.]MBK5243188.1 AAA family ATPase [Clostridium sp.]